MKVVRRNIVLFSLFLSIIGSDNMALNFLIFASACLLLMANLIILDSLKFFTLVFF